MLSLDLRSARTPEMVVISAAQPVSSHSPIGSNAQRQSLPPPATVASMLSLPSISSFLMPPCIIPWPFRGLCPSRLLGYGEQSSSLARKKRRGGNDAVLLSKTLMEGVMVNPSLGGDTVLGSAFVSIGRLKFRRVVPKLTISQVAKIISRTIQLLRCRKKCGPPAG